MDQNGAGTLQRIDALDGWRAISVGLVIVSHLSRIAGLRGPTGDAILSLALEYGKMGVEVFFVISGFVICTGLLGEARPSLAGFYIRRFFRIVPALCLFLLVNAVLARAGLIEISAVSFVRALTFTCNLGECSWPLGHTWSLAYEEQFYLVFPLAFIVAGLRRKTAVIGVLLLMALSMLVLSWYRVPHGAGAIRHFFSIGCGVAAALHREQLTVLLRAVAWPWIGAAALVPLLIPLVPDSSGFAWVSYLACSPAITIALLGSAIHAQFRWLAWPPLTAIGRASYGIYLWQQLATADYASPSIGLNLLLLAGLSIVVWASYRFVERPLIALGRKLARSGPSGKPVSAPR